MGSTSIRVGSCEGEQKISMLDSTTKWFVEGLHLISKVIKQAPPPQPK